MLGLALFAVLTAFVGAVTGLAAARWLLCRQAGHRSTPPDPFVSAEIDRAAVEWAESQGQPEAAEVMADKLHLLYALGRRRQKP
jgi:hypothetical protein